MSDHGPLRAGLRQIEEDAGWLHDNTPDYSPDGVATLGDVARTIAQMAHQLEAALPPRETTLDETTLEQALRNVTNANHWNVHNTDGDYVGRPRVAAALAREYAALARALRGET